MRQFNQTVLVDDQRSRTIARNTSVIMRLGGAVVAIAGPFLFVLIFQLTVHMGTMTRDMNQMRQYMTAMRGDFDTVVAEMAPMDRAVAAMREEVSVLPVMTDSVGAMNQTMSIMNGNMDAFAFHTHGIRVRIDYMGGELARMDDLLGVMTATVGGMNRDVRVMSSPVRAIPFLRR